MSKYEAPQLRDMPISPSPEERSRKNSNPLPGTFQQLLSDRNVLNSIRWGFGLGTAYTFIALYHTNGQILRSIAHGAIGCLCCIPAK